ncbi:hypothetical protein [Ahniella affigens]|uniref:hypothetical protein n=1 Tax=Ahniella affigens TaxID=2021234 RepID=UPI003CCCCE10
MLGSRVSISWLEILQNIPELRFQTLQDRVLTLKQVERNCGLKWIPFVPFDPQRLEVA